jgi:hypothetical protein
MGEKNLAFCDNTRSRPQYMPCLLVDQLELDSPVKITYFRSLPLFAEGSRADFPEILLGFGADQFSGL